MEYFGQFSLDKEKDILVELYREGEELRYVLRTPNHGTGNLIRNLARLCALPLSEDEQGLMVIRGTVPSYVDGDDRQLWIFRLGNTKVANIRPDGSVELKASIPAISKALMSQTKDYRLSEQKSIVKTYIFSDCKFHTDLHTHMSANLSPDLLIALGIHHQIRYPLYYIRKLGLRCTPAQEALLAQRRAAAEDALGDTALTGKYRERRIDDNTFLNFADLIVNNGADAAYNIARIRVSLAVPKDGQAVFADLEKVYLYRYVFTKGAPAEDPIRLPSPVSVPDADIAAALRQMALDRENPAFRHNTLFQDKLLWIARNYRRYGIEYAEISDTSLCKAEAAPAVLRQIHEVMPAVTAETGVLLRFLAAIRRTPLTIVRDHVTPDDYLAENLQVLRAVACDPYVAGSDIVGEEINDILELQNGIRELVRIAGETPGFVLRVHAGENDSLRDNVANTIRCVHDSLAPGQSMPHVRIGHGLYTPNLRSPGGQRLLNRLREDGVTLEFQLTSNVRLNNLSDLERHPLRQYLRAGIPCVQGTDGGALYGTNSIDEELALEKLLGLSHEELCQMRAAEAAVERESRASFDEKRGRLSEPAPDGDWESFYARRIADTPRPDAALWTGGGKGDAQDALRRQIRELPAGKLPLILAGGSFNSDRHATQMRPGGRAILDTLLEKADPDRLFFVVGHRLTAYERYLVENNRGKFEIFAIVPAALSAAEAVRLRRSGVGVRVSIEPSGNGLYKSFAYEIFKRRSSLLLAFDGNSPAANLVQEAKNGRYKCAIYVSRRCRALCAKARMLQGYVQLFGESAEFAEKLLEEQHLRA